MRTENSVSISAFGKGFKCLVASPGVISCLLVLVCGPWSFVLGRSRPAIIDEERQALGPRLTALTPYLGHPIAKVEILYGGAPPRGEDVRLVDVIGIRAGEKLDLARIHDALIRLYRSGEAANVVVTASGPPTAMTLRFDITPQPRVADVIFAGVESAAIRDELRRRLSLSRGALVRRGQLNRAADEIVDYYHQLGYFDAQAIPEVAPQAGGREATIIFHITPGEQATIGSVRFRGTLKLPVAEARRVLNLDPGSPYSARRVRDGVERLRRWHLERGYLAVHIGRAEIARRPEKNQVRITIPIDSGPTVEIRVEGIDLHPEQQKQLLPTLDVGGIDDATLEEGRLNILEDLQRRGYFFAEVNYQRLQPSDDHVVIVYRVAPGRKYTLKEIRIEGLPADVVKEVIAQLHSRPGGLFSRGLTSRELMREDQRAIVQYLRVRGYLSARVTESRLAVGLNREDLIIIYVVDTGPQSHIDEIVFRGNEAFSDEELQAQLEIAAGQPLSQPHISEEAARLSAFYSAHGYAESTVDASIEFVDGHAPDVRVIFTIREGRQLRIHRLLFRGNEITREPAIRKYLQFHEGQLLINERLQASEQNLYSTGAFRRVTIHPVTAGAGSEYANRRNVIIELVEAPRFLLTYGGGFRTDDGPRGLFEITNTNLLGRLYTGSFRIRASRREQLGQLSFTNPRPFGSAWPLLASTFFQREERDAFDASRLTGLVQLERQLPGNSLLILRYSFSKVIISDVTEPERLRRQDTTARLGRLSGSFLRDLRDSVFEPTRGSFTSLDLSIASSALGGEENFVRFFAEHQRYYRVLGLRSVVFALDARLGVAKPFGATRSILISERFFAGGSTTLRGFGFEEAGPRGLNPNRPGQTQPLGGDMLAILNAELRFPIWKRIGLGGTLFYDGGNVFIKFSDIKAEALPGTRRHFTHTLGFGFRIKTPVGPIRLDFGVLVRREPLVPRTQFHVSFGPSF